MTKMLYQEYIAFMAPKWAESSVRSESQRLDRLWDSIDGNPQKLWDALKNLQPYTRVTYWGRVTCFWDWQIKKKGLAGPNPYSIFREENPRCFRGCYIRKPAKHSFQEALDLIMTIPDEGRRNKCLQLLTGGLRFSESFTLTPDGYVTGKGGKVRRVYPADVKGPMASKSEYSSILRDLKTRGLRPHKLRSIKMTDMVDNGATTFQLQKFAGWSSIDTAQSYVNVRDEDVQAIAHKSNKRITEQATSIVLKMAAGFAAVLKKRLERVE